MKLAQLAIFLLFLLYANIGVGATDSIKILQKGETYKLNSTSLFPDLCVSKIIIDQNGRLWFQPCTASMQSFRSYLFQFDGIEAKEILLENAANQEILSRSSIEITHLDKFGKLHGLIINNNELTDHFILDVQTGEFDIVSTIGGIGEGIETYHSALGKDSSTLFLSKKGSTSLIHRYNGEEFILEIELTGLISNQYRSSRLIGESEEAIWIVDEHFNIIRIDHNSKTTQKLNKIESWLPNYHIPNHTYTSVLNIDGKEVLYINYSKGQLYEYNREKETLNVWDKGPEILNKDIITDRYINVYRDPSGNIAFSTLNHFLIRDPNGIWYDGSSFRPENFLEVTDITSNDYLSNITYSSDDGIYFHKFKSSVLLNNVIQNLNGCRTIREVSSTEILVGTDAGTYSIDLISNSKIELNPEFNIDGSIIYNLIDRGDGNYFFNDVKHGYGCHNLKTKETIFKIDYINPANLTKETDSTFIIINDDRKLYRQHLFTGDISEIKLDKYPWPSSPVFQHGNIIDNVFWLATSYALISLDLNTLQVNSYTKGGGFSDARFVYIFELNKDELWLATYSEGIIKFNPKTRKIVGKINSDNGLSNNTVTGIVKDDNGYLWAATFNGLNLLDQHGNVLLKYSESDGISKSEFNRGSQRKLKDGRIAFGTIRGLNIITPNNISPNTSANDLQIYLTSARYFDKSNGKDSTHYQFRKEVEEIKLSASHRDLYLQFALSSYFKYFDNQYSYKIGEDKEWQYLGSLNSLNLTNLEPGKYKIYLKGTDTRGTQSSNILTIPISVNSYFYYQWWFYGLCLLFVVAISIAVIQGLRTANKSLDELVKERTKQIEKDKGLIEQQAKELQQMAKVKSHLFENISHELRTPITLINTPLEIFIRQNKLSQNQNKELKTVLSNGYKLQELVEELIDLSRIESNTIELFPEPTPLDEFSKLLFQAFETVAKIKQIKYNYNSALSEEVIIEIDRKRFGKVLNNLLSNALKFTPANETVSLFISRNTGNISIEIRDTGIGIPPSDLPFLFERYWQSFSGEGGMGIGLALAKELTELMNGSLTVESKAGEGSSFFFDFPEVISKEKPMPISGLYARNMEEESTNEVLNLPKILTGKVLVVEDNTEMQNLLLQILKPNYTCIVASNGQEAWDMIKDNHPSTMGIELILSDMMMPIMDGIGLIELLKANTIWQNVPVIILTAKQSQQIKLHALRIGVDDYLFKPFTEDEILVRIHNRIENYRLRTAFQQAHEIIDQNIAADNNINTKHSNTDQAWLKEVEQKARQAINQGITLTVSYLAENAYLSERQFRRNIQAATGLTPNKYILSIRLAKARTMLEENTFRSAAEVSHAVGFSSSGYFSRVYREQYGKRPAEYF